jgi:hypothetical protein
MGVSLALRDMDHDRGTDDRGGHRGARFREPCPIKTSLARQTDDVADMPRTSHRSFRLVDTLAVSRVRPTRHRAKHPPFALLGVSHRSRPAFESSAVLRDRSCARGHE